MKSLFDIIAAPHRPRAQEALNVVLFAGGGGADVGIEAAGFPVHVAINHDPEAVAMHMANFPNCRHFTQNVWNVSPVWATQGRPVGRLWASPDCKHFSRAKGAALLDRNIRDLAWVIVKWAEEVRPEFIFLENVPEFKSWCELVPAFDAKGRPKMDKKTGKQRLIPDKRQIDAKGEGSIFKAWRRRMRRAGYRLDFRELSACDFGTPTTRRRLFMVARRDGLPVVWPRPTHGPAGSPGVRAGRLLPYATAASCINWNDPCPSIFERKRELKVKSRLRIARGIRKFILEAAAPFVVHGAVRGRATAAHVVRDFGQSIGSAMSEPIGSLTASGGGKAGISLTYIVKQRGTTTGSRADEPLHTVSAGGKHHGLVLAHALKYYGTNIGFPLDEPAHTVTTKHRHGLVLSRTCGAHAAAVRDLLCWARRFNVEWKEGQADEWGQLLADAFEGEMVHQGAVYRIEDIGFRMLSPRELARAQGFDDSFVLDADCNGKPLTKTAQVRMIGNSVPPQFPEALIRSNVPAPVRAAAAS